jgi:hypothetical protein
MSGRPRGTGCRAAAEIPNGGFETGDFTDWTVSGNTGYTSVASSLTPILRGSEDYVDIGPVGSDGVLTQTLMTEPGSSYVLSFSRTNFGGPDDDFSVSFDRNPISFAGTPSLPIREPGADVLDWTNYGAIVTASGAKHRSGVLLSAESELLRVDQSFGLGRAAAGRRGLARFGPARTDRHRIGAAQERPGVRQNGA